MNDHDAGNRPDSDQPSGPRQPEIEALLGRHFGRSPSDLVNWTALEARIVAGARPWLSRRARRGAAERWGRIAIPVGLAAAILIAVGLYLAPADEPADDVPDMAQVAAVSASDLLPADPLSLTDQEAFLAVMLAPAER